MKPKTSWREGRYISVGDAIDFCESCALINKKGDYYYLQKLDEFHHLLLIARSMHLAIAFNSPKPQPAILQTKSASYPGHGCEVAGLVRG